MKWIFALLAALGMSASLHAAPLQTQAMEESNTVPSNELITDYDIIKTAGEPDAAVDVTFFRAGKGSDGPSMLTISDNETVTVSVQNQSVVCEPAVDCRIPYVKGATYKVELKRFNGEISQTSVDLPDETGIVSPNDHIILGKADALHVTWIPVKCSGPYGFTESVFLDDQSTTCDTTGWTSWDSDSSATVPANYVSTCQLPLLARFSVFYQNIALVHGVAGGALKGYSVANLNYSYMDSDLKKVDLSPKHWTQTELHQFAQSQSTGPLVTKTIQR